MTNKHYKTSFSSTLFAVLVITGFGFLLVNELFRMPWHEWFLLRTPDWAAILNVVIIGISGYMVITRWPVSLVVRAIFFIFFLLSGSLWNVSVSKAPTISYIVMILLFGAVIVISGLRKSDKTER